MIIISKLIHFVELLKPFKTFPKKGLLESDPLFFTACDDHVKDVSRRWYKSLNKLVKHLMEIIEDFSEYKQRRDLMKVRAIYVWIHENMR